MSIGPRIYNLFPLLAGPIAAWNSHLPRIENMGFNWIFINPIQYPGFSGSLYAIKDFYRLHPLVQDSSPEEPDELVRNFVSAAKHHGMSVMMDLVINHTAKDSLLAEDHPEWFDHDESGLLKSPRAIDPADTRRITVWGDLAEIGWNSKAHQDARISWFSDVIAHYISLGIRGFRCDAAYKVPAEVWKLLIDAARTRLPDILFAAETLGCTESQVLALEGAGFDFMFNSSKWWDFRAPWLLQQYEHNRKIAPSISFPESHDTERFSAELSAYGLDHAKTMKWYRLRYLFAAAFSTGVMIPMGYEYGFSHRLDVCKTRMGDWAAEAANPHFDLHDFIRNVNLAKQSCPTLNTECPQRQISVQGDPLVALWREHENHFSLFLMNRDESIPRDFPALAILATANGRRIAFSELTPGFAPVSLAMGESITVPPLEGRLFCGQLT